MKSQTYIINLPKNSLFTTRPWPWHIRIFSLKLKKKSKILVTFFFYFATQIVLSFIKYLLISEKKLNAIFLLFWGPWKLLKRTPIRIVYELNHQLHAHAVFTLPIRQTDPCPCTRQNFSLTPTPSNLRYLVKHKSLQRNHVSKLVSWRIIMRESHNYAIKIFCYLSVFINFNISLCKKWLGETILNSAT